MSYETAGDVRSRLVESKFFTLRPKPLEQWLWQQRIPATAERLYWLHWEEGMRNGTWCSEIALKRAAATCCVDVSTITRAYRVLQRAGLLRRVNPGHDPHNPFQQAITITEVLVPTELARGLDRHPNRPPKRTEPKVVNVTAKPPHTPAPEPAPEPRLAYSSADITAAFNVMSSDERVSFYEATKHRKQEMCFDVTSRLSPPQKAMIVAHIADLIRAVTKAMPAAQPLSSKPVGLPSSAPRRLSPFDAGRLRRRLLEIKPHGGDQLFRECAWSIEQGALSRLDIAKAVNVAIKLVREGAWTKPNKMPPNWMVGSALPELCVAA